MEINLSEEMIRTVHSVLSSVPQHQLASITFGEPTHGYMVSGEDALQVFDDLVEEMDREAIRTQQLKSLMDKWASEDSQHAS